jgi:hypothetical protein
VAAFEAWWGSGGFNLEETRCRKVT